MTGVGSFSSHVSRVGCQVRQSAEGQGAAGPALAVASWVAAGGAMFIEAVSFDRGEAQEIFTGAGCQLEFADNAPATHGHQSSPEPEQTASLRVFRYALCLWTDNLRCV